MLLHNTNQFTNLYNTPKYCTLILIDQIRFLSKFQLKWQIPMYVKSVNVICKSLSTSQHYQLRFLKKFSVTYFFTLTFLIILIDPLIFKTQNKQNQIKINDKNLFLALKNMIF